MWSDQCQAAVARPSPSNKHNSRFSELASTAAGFAPDRMVVNELPLTLRGRPRSEVPSLICLALHAAGAGSGRVTLQADEEAAALELLARV